MKKYTVVVAVLLCMVSNLYYANAQRIQSNPQRLDTLRCSAQRCTPVTLTFPVRDNIDSLFISTLGQGKNFTLSGITLPIVTTNQQAQVIVCYSPTQPTSSDTAYIVARYSSKQFDTAVVVGYSYKSPFLRLSQNNVNFRTSTVNTTRCVSIDVTNEGDTTLVLPPPIELDNATFSVTYIGKTTLEPKESSTMLCCFSPTVVGPAIDTALFVFSSCYPATQLILRGVSATVAGLEIGGVLQASPSPLDFGKVLCGDSACLYVNIQNIGSRESLFKSIIKRPSNPFTLTDEPPTQSILEQDSSRQLRVCYAPKTIGKNSDYIDLLVDSRLPINIALLFDVSNSMLDPISVVDSKVRIVAAKEAGVLFANSLLFDIERGISDTSAVFSFSGSFRVRQNFTTSKQNLVNSIQNLTTSPNTCLYYGIVESVKLLTGRTNPVLVVLSDGEDNCSNFRTTFTQAINSARAAGVKVYIVAIVDKEDPSVKAYIDDLTEIATQTQGEVFFAKSSQEITDAYATIANKLSQNVTLRIPVLGEAIPAGPIFSPNPVDFDSIRIHTEKCRSVTVTNNSVLPFYVTEEAFSLPVDYSLSDLPLAAVQPGNSATFTLCFTPRKLRAQNSNVSFGLTVCSAAPLKVQGVGYDSVIVEFSDELIGFPGDTLVYTARLLDTIPSEYGVDSLALTFQYNSTLLYPLLLPSTENGTISGLGGLQFKQQYSTDTAITSYTYKTGRLIQSNFNQTLFERPFLLLSGNEMETPLRITSLKLADGNPKVGIVQPAKASLDPSCFQSSRLLDAVKRRNGVVLAALTYNHADDNISGSVQLTQSATIKLSVVDVLGKESILQEINAHPQGNLSLSASLRNVASGMYAIVVSVNGTPIETRMVVKP